MQTKNWLVTVLWLLSSSLLYGQTGESVNRSFNVDGSKIIRLVNLLGNVELKNSDDNKIHIKTIFRKGDAGIGIASIMDSYQLVDVNDGESITIRPETTHSKPTVSFSSDKEQMIINEISIPYHLRVEVRLVRAEITVSGSFYELDLINKSGQSDIQISKKDILLISAAGKNGEIWVNGENRETYFSKMYDGKTIYNLTTKTGVLNIDVK